MRRSGRPRGAILVSGLLAIMLAVVAAAPGTALAWSAGTFSPSDESLLFSLTNQARASAGLGPLRNSSALHGLAQWRSKDMAERGYFAHEIPPDGKMVFDYMDARGIQYVLAGENIGWNNAPDDQATQYIQQMFMDSTGHRANILNPLWDSMGIGAFKGADGKAFYTVLFMQSKAAATPKPTPRATPPPEPAPTQHATPRPTPTPAPRATQRLVPRATPADTPTPASSPASGPTATPAPTQPPAPEPTAEPPTAAPTPTDVPAGLPAATDDAIPPAAPPAPPTSGVPGWAADGGSLRVVDAPSSRGLLDIVVGGILGFLFGS
jgi:uncharacterized protein YkwD